VDRVCNRSGGRYMYDYQDLKWTILGLLIAVLAVMWVWIRLKYGIGVNK